MTIDAIADLNRQQERAQDRGLPVAGQYLVAKDPDSSVRTFLAANKNLDLTVQRLLIRDESVDVRRLLAQNAALVPELQAILARDAEPRVQHYLAANAALDPRLQLVLVMSQASVRRRLAKRPDLVHEVQLILMRDTEVSVRWLLGQNTNTVLTSALPLEFLENNLRGQQFVADFLTSSNLDHGDLDALRVGWTGTLDELVKTAQELAAETA